MNKLKKIADKIENDKQNFFLKKFLKVIDHYWEKYVVLISEGRDVNIKNAKDIKTTVDFGSLEIPKEITIKNAKEIAEYIVIPKNKFPNSIEVSNLGDLSKYFELLNKIEIPKEFSIKNIKDASKVEFPENLKKLSSAKTEEILGKVLLSLKKNKPKNDVFIKNKNPEEYIPVRIVDKRGEDWLKDFGQTIVTARSSVYLFNTEREQINPATEENQTNRLQKTGLVDQRNEDIETDNPLAVRDVDDANRLSQNTIFGEKIQGKRKPIISAQFQYGISSDGSTITNANGGQSIIEDSLLKVSTGTNVAGGSIIQTTDYLRYIPGHEGYMYFTAVFSEGKADSYQRAGLFDGTDGFLIGYEGVDFKITRMRDGVTETKTIVLEDVFETDLFDPTKGNVYKISFGYLGFATIIFEIMNKKGAWRELGKFEYPNSSTVTHVKQTSLPARAETANTGNTTNLEMRSGSFSVGIVDGGGTDPSARLFSASVPTTTISAGNYLVATFRNKATFYSIANRIKARLMLISATTDLSKISSWKLIRNATITNTPTWTDVNTSDSIMEYSTDATIDFNSGDDLIPWSLAKVDSFFEQIEEQLIEIRPGETSSVVIITPVGTTGDVETAFRWKELF